jgi:adenine deaminase
LQTIFIGREENIRVLFDKFPNRRLMETALGKEPADMVLKNGVLADVYTGRMIPEQSLAISGKWIAYVGLSADHTIGEKTHVVDVDGRTVTPGFIDAHTHIAYHWNLADFLRYAVPGGTTTFITEVESFVCAHGAKGFRIFLDQARNQPVKVLSLIPPLITLSPASESRRLSHDEVMTFLKDETVIGLGESYWQGVVFPRDEYVMALMRDTLKARKSVQGHAAGASDQKLAAYAALGALSCHEAVSTEDVLSRLQLGYYVMIREGYIRRDLEIIMPLIESMDTRRLILVTDGTEPNLLLEKGYLVDVVQKAVDMGLEPIKAIQMVSINPAEHFGIDHCVGGISPGRLADLLIIPQPKTIKPDLVISNGRIVAEKGQITTPFERRPYPEAFLNTVKVRQIHPSELHVPPTGDGDLRIIDIQAGGLVTREAWVKTGQGGQGPSADPQQDVLKIVFIERASGAGERFVGFIRGWGQEKGAVATTLCWDASGIMAIGENDDDLCMAINRLIENQGGTALVIDGNVDIDIPHPVGGYVSLMDMEEITVKMRRFQEAMVHLGSSLGSAHLTLCTLSSAAIPFIRMTEKGYYRFRENDIVGLA